MHNRKIQSPEYFIGLLSGTSIDSIDAAIFAIEPNMIQLVLAHSYEIGRGLKLELNNIISNPTIELEKLGKLNRELDKPSRKLC